MLRNILKELQDLKSAHIKQGVAIDRLIFIEKRRLQEAYSRHGGKDDK